MQRPISARLSLKAAQEKPRIQLSANQSKTFQQRQLFDLNPSSRAVRRAEFVVQSLKKRRQPTQVAQKDA
jgi:hypothetical protein